ncbi:flagellar protein FlgN [Vibrio ostreicida]|uniref:Flagellar protein FlgN n=1 Tax=Vibrio ostreicida TaxID=526588 RepID=A0ABT8BST1_9VIBR|nr:flagellar protein FlgN [Vibrio ostreicida]MDN3609434.1 flagellar protein FlgN [Vibrio ostreicida]NPD08317.1 flagellar protein FlgN [Vibrio ostreicida]
MTTSDPSRLIKQYVKTIGQDIRLYQQLTPLLREQKQLYLTLDATRLSANLEQQKPLLNQLIAHAEERRQTMITLALPVEKRGVDKLISLLPPAISKQVSAQCRMLQGMIEQCQKLNQDNGQTSANFHELMVQITQPNQHTYADKI